MAQVPSEAVTFLFTDIASSTKLWERYPDTMKVALARHDSILQHAIEKHGGRVFKTVGDSFYTVFASAADALDAAIDAQRKLYAERWGEIGAMRVRMVLHTGSAEERDGDYFGPTINHILSLMYTGHGGQILLSQATQKLVRGSLPLGAQLRDLGMRRLKDLTGSEHIFQIVTPDLPVDFPPLRTLDSRSTNLPAQSTALVGRELEVAAACAFLRRPQVRMLTLTGPGGIGKTRLGLQVAANMLEEFEDGVFFVPLGMVWAAHLVAPAIAQALGISEAAGRPLLDGLYTFLSDKQVLLMFDNFEHILEATPLVLDLLAKSPRLKVVIASRAALRAPDEYVLPVPPLALPKLERLPHKIRQLLQYSAIALFVERAQAVRPDFALTDDNALAVAKICTRLDCLPLAIELAAARSRLLSPQAMLGRLDRRLSLLTGGARNLPLRQQTMRGAIAWSHDLLNADEQKLFRRLAVFAGGGSLQAAEAVVGVSLDGLATLIDNSLVRQEENAGQPRLTMLEIIREYAQEQLAASETIQDVEMLQQRHAEFFLKLAETAEPRLTGPDQIAWLEQLEVEHNNLQAALKWYQKDSSNHVKSLRLAGALWRFWYLRGHWSEGHAELERALALPGALEHTAARAKALYAAGELARLHGDNQAAQHMLDASLELWQKQNNPHEIARAQTSLGMMALGKNDHVTALALLTESVNRLRTGEDRHSLAFALRCLGTVYGQTEPAAARALFEESLALFREVGDKWGQAMSLGNLGFLAYLQADHAQARSLYEESLSIFRQVGDKWLIADALNVLGEVARCQDDYERAAELYEESLSLHRALGSKRGIAALLHNVGCVALYHHDRQQAAAYFTESLAMERERGQTSGILLALMGLAGVAVLQAQSIPPPSCFEHYRRAAQLLGAVEALCRTFGVSIDPADRIEYDRCTAAISAWPTQASLQNARSDGRALTLEQAIACALASDI